MLFEKGRCKVFWLYVIGICVLLPASIGCFLVSPYWEDRRKDISLIKLAIGVLVALVWYPIFKFVFWAGPWLCGGGWLLAVGLAIVFLFWGKRIGDRVKSRVNEVLSSTGVE